MTHSKFAVCNRQKLRLGRNPKGSDFDLYVPVLNILYIVGLIEGILRFFDVLAANRQ